MANRAALTTAARAAIVMPLVFAIADKLIAKPQTSIFAAFGSFAVLVLVEFGGAPSTRLRAYLGLACFGTALIALGTVCSRDIWLATGMTAAAGFAVLFAGAFSGYIQAGTTAAIVTFVLAVTIAAPDSAIPDRLEGWGLANGVGLWAVMLLWPPRRREDLRRETAAALRAIADLIDAGADPAAEVAQRARTAVAGLRRSSLGAQHRPGGPTGTTAALVSLPDELDWLLAFLAPGEDAAPLQLACPEDAAALAATAAVLRGSADVLERRQRRVAVEPLDSAREAVARALVRRLSTIPATATAATATEALEPPFRIRVVTYSARQIAGYALRAAGADAQELDGREAVLPATRASLEATEHAVVDHASFHSVWFQNSARGAIGLAAAVYVAQRTGVQHGFWVVLGMLSVLRSNALGTGWSILSALAGTAAGLVAGALLVIGIGTHETVLWAVLPVAVLLAAYAPRAISFAAGQAGFTVVLFILYNIIKPIGWRVGVVRVEDVAIGFAISLGVGLLFWPRGAGALLRNQLATAYARAVDSAVTTTRQLIDGDDPVTAAAAARAAEVALHRLDDAFRQYLTERSASAIDVDDVAALVAGATRVNRAAQSLAALGQLAGGGARLATCARNLDRELHALQSWYVTLGYDIVNGRPVPPPHLRDGEGRSRLLACIRQAAGGGDEPDVRASLVLLWVSQHLDSLWRLEEHLEARANAARAAAVDAGLLGKLGLARS